MPLVFVHGVNVRYDSPADDPFVNARTGLFRRFALPRLVKDPEQTLVLNPYWGNLAAKFAWNHAALPSGRYEVFGSDDTISAGLLSIKPEAVEDPDTALLSVARDSLGTAVDMIWRVAALNLDANVVANFADAAVEVASYVEFNDAPDWLGTISNDSQFLTTLINEAQRWGEVNANLNQARDPVRTANRIETFGADRFSDRLFAAVEQIRASVVAAGDDVKRAATRARRPADNVFLKARAPMHRMLTTFLGDVFVYFHQRETSRKLIADTILADLHKAVANSSSTGEPLIVVAHSMGGIILYDLLTSVLTNVTVDVLVTVGSQIAVMEELKLFTASDPSVPDSTRKEVPRPSNVKRWLNVFDTTDILGFAASGVFSGVEDYVFATGHAWAHGGYFVEPMFHRRLGARLS
jgi:hypothetical protein